MSMRGRGKLLVIHFTKTKEDVLFTEHFLIIFLLELNLAFNFFVFAWILGKLTIEGEGGLRSFLFSYKTKLRPFLFS